MPTTLPLPPNPAIRHEPRGELSALLGQLQTLIADARQRALRAVDVIQVQTCWQVGRHIFEFEQGGAARAAYGKRLLPVLAERLTQEFGKGFDERNLRHMRAFFQVFPNWDAVRSELSWTHYRLLTRVDKAEARQWYMHEAAEQNWSSRALAWQPVIRHEPRGELADPSGFASMNGGI